MSRGQSWGAKQAAMARAWAGGGEEGGREGGGGGAPAQPLPKETDAGTCPAPAQAHLHRLAQPLLRQQEQGGRHRWVGVRSQPSLWGSPSCWQGSRV